MDIPLFHWLTHKSLFNGFNNPLYLPQLLYRTPLAMVLGGCFGLFLSAIFLPAVCHIGNLGKHGGVDQTAG